MTPAFAVEALGKQHARAAFTSGVAALDRYFREQVTQDMRRRAATCFVAVEQATQQVAAYYTLAAASIALGDLPEVLQQKLPRYPSVPAVRMGRLAVALSVAGRGLGAALLADALTRSARADIAAWALLVDAKDRAAADFYLHHGFTAFDGKPLMLFIPFGGLGKLVV